LSENWDILDKYYTEHTLNNKLNSQSEVYRRHVYTRFHYIGKLVSSQRASITNSPLIKGTCWKTV